MSGRPQPGWRRAAVALVLALASAAVPRGARGAEPGTSDVVPALSAATEAERRSRAIDVALGWVETLERGDREDAIAMARAALELAGEGVVPSLVERLRADAPEGRGAATAWSLGEVLARRAGPKGPAAPDDVVEALRFALRSPAWDVRLAAASSLGLLEATAASPDLAGLLADPTLPAAREAIVLLALAGAGGAGASQLEAFLARGGDAAWGGTVEAVFLRRGSRAWPELVRAFRDAPDVRVRAAAASTLLLLAEPRATCELIEIQGVEPEPILRRLAFQAIAASHHPLGRDFLRWAATVEPDADLRAAAEALAGDPKDEPRWQPGNRGRSLNALLAEIATGAAVPSTLDEVEWRAGPGDVGSLERTLVRLPLREDDRWRADHARLAQLRARLLCLDHPDCAP